MRNWKEASSGVFAVPTYFFLQPAPLKHRSRTAISQIVLFTRSGANQGTLRVILLRVACQAHQNQSLYPAPLAASESKSDLEGGPL